MKEPIKARIKIDITAKYASCEPLFLIKIKGTFKIAAKSINGNAKLFVK